MEQAQHRARNNCGIAAHRRRRIANRRHTGNVGRAAFILSAGIDEQQPIGLEHRTSVNRGRVVRQRCIGAISRYGCETLFKKFGIFRAPSMQHLRSIRFGQNIACRKTFVKFGIKLRQCNSILEMRLLDGTNLFGRLHAFEHHGGRRGAHLRLGRHKRCKQTVGVVRIEHHLPTERSRRQCFVERRGRYGRNTRIGDRPRGFC